jgi:DNA-binding transcriptional ArsR family regulator
MPRRKRSEETGLLVALRHPLRRRILQAMAGREAISPRELTGLVDQPLSNVSYHVRVLAECRAIKLVRTKPVRGSVQHFYRASVEARWARQVLGLDEAGAGEPGKPGESSEGSAT